MNTLPALFEERMRKLLPEESEAFFAALQTEPPVSIRLNPGKPVPISRLFPDEQIGLPVSWCESAYYLKSRPVFTLDPCLHSGTYYVQEASSMFLHHIFGQILPAHPVRVLDLCAAPGGKSTLIASRLSSGSLLVANEVIRSRAGILKENMIKWGTSHVVVTNNDPADFHHLKGAFDIIVVDAPCSGEGMFRKDPAAITEWSAANVAHCAERQRAILSDVWNALRPGGLFIYSTCTYNTEENEEMIGFLRKKFGAIPLTVDIDPAWNITPALVGDLPAYRFMPHRTRGEGLFMAILRKPGEPGETRREALLSTAEKTEKRNKKNKTPRIAIHDEWRLLVANPDRYTFISDEEKIIAIPAEYTTDYKLLDRHLDLLHTGITVATLKGKDYVPHISLALSTAFDTNQVVHYEAPLDTALAYLRRESLFLPTDLPRGYILVTYEGFPLGWAKHLGNRTNNLYPQEWRIRSGYTPDTPFELNIAPK